MFADLSRRVPHPCTFRRDDRCVRVVRLANYVAPASGGLRTALAELGVGYLAAGHEPVLVVPGSRPERRQTWQGLVITVPGVPVPGTGGYRVITARRSLRRLLEDLQRPTASSPCAGDCVTFASVWDAHNDQVLAESGPLWVVLGDSTAQGLGAPSPMGGYVGQVLAGLRQRTGQRWRVLNLSLSGALIRDVMRNQLPRVPAGADLVTCGTGANDILYSAPAKLFADLRTLIGAVPGNTVLLDLPLPTGIWGIIGRASIPYVTRINQTIRQAAGARGLPVAEVSAHFQPPWGGKFASDSFHPSQDGYRDWARALLAAIPAGTEIAGISAP
jgi:acyl-CoA thioesterase-1